MGNILLATHLECQPGKGAGWEARRPGLYPQHGYTPTLQPWARHLPLLSLKFTISQVGKSLTLPTGWAAKRPSELMEVNMLRELKSPVQAEISTHSLKTI